MEYQSYGMLMDAKQKQKKEQQQKNPKTNKKPKGKECYHYLVYLTLYIK